MRILKLLCLHICHLLGLFYITMSGTRGKLLILCYHGFELKDESKFRPKLFMSEERFRSHMEILSKHKVQVLPLPVALEKLYQGRLSTGAVAITIDDGFFSDYAIGYPVLRSYNFPATLYIYSYYVNKDVPVFRLAVQYMFWKSEVEKIELNDIVWTDNEFVDLRNKKASDKVMWQCITYGEKLSSETERMILLSELSSLFDVDLQAMKSNRMFSLLTLDEIRELSENGMDIQLHTHNHEFPMDNEVIAKQEILRNREVLSKVTNKELVHFCYPSGIWNMQQWHWLDSLGIRSATTCETGYNDASIHKFALKRFLDGENISDIEFLSEITGFSEKLRSVREKLRLD